MIINQRDVFTWTLGCGYILPDQSSQNNKIIAPVWSTGRVESMYRGVRRLYHTVKQNPISWERCHEPPLNKTCAVVAAWFDQERQRYLIRSCHNISFNAVQVRERILEYLDWNVDGGLRWSSLVEENRYQTIHFSFMLKRFDVSVHFFECKSLGLTISFLRDRISFVLSVD